MANDMINCSDSGAQILRPITNGTAWCGNCGATVDAVTRLGDSNQILCYADHKTPGGFWERYAAAAYREEHGPMPSYLDN